MTTARARLEVNTRVFYEGAHYVVTGLDSGVIRLRSTDGRASIISAQELLTASDFRVVGAEQPEVSASPPYFPDNVPAEAQKTATDLQADLLEALTGYRTGSQASALPHEPRPQYDPATTGRTQRLEVKAEELGISRRSIFNKVSRLEAQGWYGLVDHRAVRIGGDSIDAKIKDIVRAVLAEQTNSSTVSRGQTLRKTLRKLEELPDDSRPKVPSDSTLLRLINKLSAGVGTFGSAKSRRNAANRPKSSYSHFEATRPGEKVLIDTTPFDAFAMEPSKFQWIQLQLTIAYDLFSRSILAWRFTPVSTGQVDAALLLYDVIRPKLAQPDWPACAQWAYVGVPEAILIEIKASTGAHHEPLAAIPFLHPESVVVDRGRVFLSQAFEQACKHLGIDLCVARPYTPTDKAHVERLFRTIRESFVESLPGYKGPDVYSRGATVEDEAYYSLDEIDARFAHWVVTHWQRRHNDGLIMPGLPAMNVSPNDMFNEGLARAGFMYVIADQTMYYQLLPTEWRTIQHYGVDVHGLRYDGDALNGFRNLKSMHTGLHPGKWPIKYDPRDYSRVFFYDDMLDQWQTLSWIGITDNPRPFSGTTLTYAKRQLVSRGGNASNHDDLTRELRALLNRMDRGVEQDRKERRLAAIDAARTNLAQRDRPTTANADHRADRRTSVQAEAPGFIDDDSVELEPKVLRHVQDATDEQLDEDDWDV